MYLRTLLTGERLGPLTGKPSIDRPCLINYSNEEIASIIPKRRIYMDLVESSIREKNMDLLYQTMANALEPIAFEIEPELNQVKMDMEDAGLVRILMSGSGSSMLGFSVDEDVISSAYEQLKEKYDFVEIVHVGG